MKTITLNIKDGYIQGVLDFLKSLPKDAVKVNYEDDDIATEEDKKTYEEALEDLKNGNSISIKKYLQKRNVLTVLSEIAEDLGVEDLAENHDKYLYHQ